MDLFSLPALPPERQRNIGEALAELFKEKKPPYVPDVVTRGRAVVAATAALEPDGGDTMFEIDGATDIIIAAVRRIVDASERALTDKVVDLGPEQQAQLDATQTVREAWFAGGIDFIHDSVGIQCGVMLKMRSALDEPTKGPQLRAALKTLGLKAITDHFFKHVDLYAAKLGLKPDTAEGTSPKADGATWHDLYTAYAVAASSAYSDNPKTRLVLLGSYDQQLRQHREDLAKARRKRTKKAQAASDGAAKGSAAKSGGEAAKGGGEVAKGNGGPG